MGKERLASRIRRALHKPSSKAAARLKVGEAIELTGLELAGNNKVESALNKAGRLVLKGMYRGRLAKLYEAANPAHAAFIASVSTSLPSHFPQVLAVQERFLLVEWVEGQSCDELVRGSESGAVLHALAQVQKRLHGLRPPAAPGFDYWNDLIRPRFVRAAELAGRPKLLEQVAQVVDPAWAANPVLVHPDVSPANVVRTADGRFVVIDNELLSAGGLPLNDLCNTAGALAVDAVRAYADAYPGVDALSSSREAVGWMSVARWLGSHFVAGRIEAMIELADAAERDGPRLPL